MLKTILAAYALDKENIQVEPLGTGLINHTWKVVDGNQSFILQKINEKVFQQPRLIDDNIALIANHLKQHAPDYLFVSPLPTTNGDTLHYQAGEGYFRLFPFVTASKTITTVQTEQQAYEAAFQFGQFTKLCKGIDYNKLNITIPDFHNLSLRYQQFNTAIEHGNSVRINEATEMINKLKQYACIVDEYEKIKTNPLFKLRVTHHDTKISNVLFDKNDKALCVIDLDTIMPGYFISDVGDMIRTYVCPVSEEEKDFSKIVVRQTFYDAIINGYSKAMQAELTEAEQSAFFYAGCFMIYMQALRFLTDYLQDDIYYGAKYPEHNFIRAKNQLVLLERLGEVRNYHRFL